MADHGASARSVALVVLLSAPAMRLGAREFGWKLLDAPRPATAEFNSTMKATKNTCTICGATLKGFRPGFPDVCDSVCHRAKKAGVTRGREMEREVWNVAHHPPIIEQLTALADRIRVELSEEIFYNQPYLMPQAA